MQMTTTGIIIREINIEDDRLLTILTGNYGVLSAYARGAKGLKGKLVSSTELLCYSRFVLFKNKDKIYIDSAESERIFFGIRQDIEKLSLAAYMADLLIHLAPKEEEAKEQLRLMLNGLHMLETDKRSMLFVKALFELRLMTLSGYMPDLVACRDCGIFEDDSMAFIPQTGELTCKNCHTRPNDGQLFPISKGILTAMRHIIYSDFAKLFSFALPEESLVYLNQITEQYLTIQLGYKLPTLDFFKNIYLGTGLGATAKS